MDPRGKTPLPYDPEISIVQYNSMQNCVLRLRTHDMNTKSSCSIECWSAMCCLKA
jgi:hypothetical protein